MKHWKERILQMKFGKLVKRLAILSICVVLLGGLLSVVLLQPQISQITLAVQQAEQIDGFWEGHFRDWGAGIERAGMIPMVSQSLLCL